MNLNSKLFIYGEWVAPVKDCSFDTIDSATETTLAQVAAGTRDDVDRAVQAARAAFDDGAGQC